MTPRLRAGLVLFGAAVGLAVGLVVGGFGRPLWVLWFWGAGAVVAGLLARLHAPSRPGVRLLAVVLASGLVVSLVAGEVRHHVGTGYAGYSAVATSSGHVQRGRPWGTPCARVLISFGPTTPAWALTQGERVVRDAARGGLNVALDEGKPHTGIVHVVEVDWSRGQPQPGIPRHYDIATVTTGRRLQTVQELLFANIILKDPLVVREAVRAVIAVSQGIAVTATTDGSGITRHLYQSSDRFSGTDLEVLRSFSGCG